MAKVKHCDAPLQNHPGAAAGGDLGPILSDFASQLLGGFQLAALTSDFLALRPPAAAAVAAWHALLLAAAHTDGLGVAPGELH